MEWNEWLSMGLIALVIALVLFPALLMLFRRRAPAPALEDDDQPQRPLLGEMTQPLAEQIPLSTTGRSDLQRLLWAGGYYRRTALIEFRAIRTVLTLAPLLLAGAIGLVVPRYTLGRVVIAGVVGSLLGFSLPRVLLAMRARSRGRAMARGLPLAIDLLTLCLSAGQNLHAAFGQVAQELQNSHPVLAQEMAIVQRQAELHSLEFALQQWADRAQVPEVTNLVLLLIQSERLGTDTVSTLNEMAVNFRSTARQRAETQANRTSFWMLFPSIFCFWVAAALMLVGPAYLEFFDFRQRQNDQSNETTRKNIDRANQRFAPRPAPIRQ